MSLQGVLPRPTPHQNMRTVHTPAAASTNAEKALLWWLRVHLEPPLHGLYLGSAVKPKKTLRLLRFAMHGAAARFPWQSLQVSVLQLRESNHVGVVHIYLAEDFLQRPGQLECSSSATCNGFPTLWSAKAFGDCFQKHAHESMTTADL